MKIVQNKMFFIVKWFVCFRKSLITRKCSIPSSSHGFETVASHDVAIVVQNAIALLEDKLGMVQAELQALQA